MSKQIRTLVTESGRALQNPIGTIRDVHPRQGGDDVVSVVGLELAGESMKYVEGSVGRTDQLQMRILLQLDVFQGCALQGFMHK